MIRVGLLGGSGKMGEWVRKLLQTEFADRCALASAPGQGQPLQPLLDCDAVIDFSLPAAMSALTELALQRSGKLPVFVVGSTGWTADERARLEALARRTPVLQASNFSTGVLALTWLLKQAAPVLERLGYTPAIVETHHRHKKDAPSGTALSLQRAIAPAGPGNVQTLSVRAGEVIGDHEVSFYGPGDRIVLSHYAQDRSIFARGALDVALWLARNPPATGRIIGIENYFASLQN